MLAFLVVKMLGSEKIRDSLRFTDALPMGFLRFIGMFGDLWDVWRPAQDDGWTHGSRLQSGILERWEWVGYQSKGPRDF